MSRKSLRGKRVGGCSGSNAKADGKATVTLSQKLALVLPGPYCLTHSRQFWHSPEQGECEIKLEVEQWEPEPGQDTGPLVTLRMRWSGSWDSPEEWNIQWFHYLDYLGYMLPGYLREHSPAPEQMLYQLLSGLAREFQGYFGVGKLAELRASLEK